MSTCFQQIFENVRDCVSNLSEACGQPCAVAMPNLRMALSEIRRIKESELRQAQRETHNVLLHGDHAGSTGVLPFLSEKSERRSML